MEETSSQLPCMWVTESASTFANEESYRKS